MDGKTLTFPGQGGYRPSFPLKGNIKSQNLPWKSQFISSNPLALSFIFLNLSWQPPAPEQKLADWG